MTSAGIIDILVIGLLLACGAGGWAIRRRLDKLMAAQRELQIALANFDVAAFRADAALKRLEEGGIAKGAELQRAATRAEALLADLSVMAPAAERIADRIDNAVRDVRALGAGKFGRAT